MEKKKTGQDARIFIFGGDDFNDVKVIKPGGINSLLNRVSKQGGGGFRNDVYQTLGKDWNTHWHPLMFNKRGAYETRLVSKTRWTLVNQGKTPPPGVP